MKKIIINILAILFLLILFLIIITLNYSKSETNNINNNATSSFVGPDSGPSNINGPSGPPPSN